MDLAKLDTTTAAEAGADLHLLHPVTGDPLVDDVTGDDVVLTLAGMDSPRYRDHVRKITNKRMAQRRQKLSAEDVEADGLDLIVAMTLGWRNIELDGKPLACTPANARILYERAPWAREQADAFIGDRAHFFPK
jgi:hypothetical protein